MILSADNLTLDRGGVRVLDTVSAALEPGRITAILGPNGAGKSSLLMALAGLLEPAQGTVSLDGRGLAQFTPRERARAIGYLPQSADVAWDVAVETLIALGRLPHAERRFGTGGGAGGGTGSDAGRGAGFDAGRGKGKDAVENAIRSLDLGDLRRRTVNSLSGGEKARVLLARVLAGQPRWILADEPLAALDLAHGQAIIEHLRAIAGAGTGIVIVVHDLATAMNHADRVLVLDRGTLAADGAPQAALTPDTIARVWGVDARWLGNSGRHALVMHDNG